ncbi:hypothetical protein ADUPG1_012233 [Aduncisulcus paluster]|uniref:Cyclin N-terminal domain-containing protein n=1 Tax=Aduncisulcus paluster TaxID=2918883 RepID=A0ABQ5JYS6_9EUKA|nr:hypothetical protein ADUPG1_012233 [Aduncisulcus paluster]
MVVIYKELFTKIMDLCEEKQIRKPICFCALTLYLTLCTKSRDRCSSDGRDPTLITKYEFAPDISHQIAILAALSISSKALESNNINKITPSYLSSYLGKETVTASQITTAELFILRSCKWNLKTHSKIQQEIFRLSKFPYFVLRFGQILPHMWNVLTIVFHDDPRCLLRISLVRIPQVLVISVISIIIYGDRVGERIEAIKTMCESHLRASSHKKSKDGDVMIKDRPIKPPSSPGSSFVCHAAMHELCKIIDTAIEREVTLPVDTVHLLYIQSVHRMLQSVVRRVEQNRRSKKVIL